MRANLFFLFYLFPITKQFFVRSHTPANAKCNSTVAISCFAELFGMISEVCQDREISFRCVHYTFLDECFDSRVGNCDASTVAKVGSLGYRQALGKCANPNKKQKNEGIISNISPPYEGLGSPHKLITALGYLQHQCALSRNKNCSSEHITNIMGHCEERMKPASGYPQYDRHRLLRIKMDTSRKLLMYDETDKERECLVVRSTLSEMYSIHAKNCHHSIVTRCLCERLRFDVQCGINCEKLEPRSPDQDTLAWDDWKEARLIHTNSSRNIMYFIVFLISLLCSMGF